MVQTPLHYEGGEKEIKKIQKENSERKSRLLQTGT
jgi:hypothetical protein